MKTYNNKLATGPPPIRDLRINSQDRKLIPLHLMGRPNPQQAQFKDTIQILQEQITSTLQRNTLPEPSDSEAYDLLTKLNEENILLQDLSPVILMKNKPVNVLNDIINSGPADIRQERGEKLYFFLKIKFHGRTVSTVWNTGSLQYVANQQFSMKKLEAVK